MISEVSRNEDLITLLLTGHNKDSFHKELCNRPDTLEFIDFFQKAPIALHWLSGRNVLFY